MIKTDKVFFPFDQLKVLVFHCLLIFVQVSHCLLFIFTQMPTHMLVTSRRLCIHVRMYETERDGDMMRSRKKKQACRTVCEIAFVFWINVWNGEGAG